MRRTSFLACALVALSAGCGGSSKAKTDAPAYMDAPIDSGNYPPPRVIAGGGIGDGAINGVVNLYVIDDATRLPVGSASVAVGVVTGTTDATGLFITHGVQGPQTVAVAASGYRSELWVGADGANITIDLKTAADPQVTQANLSGTISGFTSVTVPAGHNKAAYVSYSEDDKATSAENNIATPGGTNACDVVGTDTTTPCSFTVATRTGQVALVAAILDHDTTLNSYTVIGWASVTGLVVANGVAQTGLTLTLVQASDVGNVTAMLGTQPTGLTTVQGVLGLELPTDGVAYLPDVGVTPPETVVKAPKLAAFSGATYRLVGLASSGSGATLAQSAVLLRGQTTTTLVAPAWIFPPLGTLTRTTGQWTTVTGALLQGATYDLDATHHLLNVSVLDGSTSFTIPTTVALPATGALAASLTALGGTLDLTNFSIDADADKITAESSQASTVN